MKKRVVEEISPFHHYSDVSVKFSLPLLPSEGGTNTMEEIEKLAIDNIQNIVYQADAELLAKWIPVICSALNLDRVGECLIVGYSQYALGDHEGLKATLRLLEVAKSDSKYSDQYNIIIYESMGGKGDNDIEKEDKIIRNITKVVTIDKAIQKI